MHPRPLVLSLPKYLRLTKDFVQLKFDANQQYQLDATQAVTDLFDGQPPAETELHFSLGAASFAAVPNRLDLLEADLLANLHAVQKRNSIS